MQKREEYMAGVPCFVDSGRPDPGAAMAFYGGLFGWEFQDVAPGGDGPSYFMARLDGLLVAGIGEQPRQDWDSVWNTYVRVDSADEAAARVTEAGGSVDAAPFDVGPAGRMAELSDPQGASFCVWEPRATRGAEGVNDAGAWVFSGLHTDDREAAQRFYGAVFGWELGAGEDETAEMIRKPGYLEFLTRSDPELPARLEALHAPEGFGDVVAQVSPCAAGDAHWDVTFAVDDADASAERADRLGGEVVTAPVDAPWVRTAVLRDPDGAAFTISQFVPETAAA